MWCDRNGLLDFLHRDGSYGLGMLGAGTGDGEAMHVGARVGS